MEVHTKKKGDKQLQKERTAKESGMFQVWPNRIHGEGQKMSQK